MSGPVQTMIELAFYRQRLLNAPKKPLGKYNDFTVTDLQLRILQICLKNFTVTRHAVETSNTAIYINFSLM